MQMVHEEGIHTDSPTATDTDVAWMSGCLVDWWDTLLREGYIHSANDLLHFALASRDTCEMVRRSKHFFIVVVPFAMYCYMRQRCRKCSPLTVGLHGCKADAFEERLSNLQDISLKGAFQTGMTPSPPPRFAKHPYPLQATWGWLLMGPTHTQSIEDGGPVQQACVVCGKDNCANENMRCSICALEGFFCGWCAIRRCVDCGAAMCREHCFVCFVCNGNLCQSCVRAYDARTNLCFKHYAQVHARRE
jgi:hypothetical protein